MARVTNSPRGLTPVAPNPGPPAANDSGAQIANAAAGVLNVLGETLGKLNKQDRQLRAQEAAKQATLDNLEERTQKIQNATLVASTAAQNIFDEARAAKENGEDFDIGDRLLRAKQDYLRQVSTQRFLHPDDYKKAIDAGNSMLDTLKPEIFENAEAEFSIAVDFAGNVVYSGADFDDDTAAVWAQNYVANILQRNPALAPVMQDFVGDGRLGFSTARERAQSVAALQSVNQGLSMTSATLDTLAKATNMAKDDKKGMFAKLYSNYVNGGVLDPAREYYDYALTKIRSGEWRPEEAAANYKKHISELASDPTFRQFLEVTEDTKTEGFLNTFATNGASALSQVDVNADIEYENMNQKLIFESEINGVLQGVPQEVRAGLGLAGRFKAAAESMTYLQALGKTTPAGEVMMQVLQFQETKASDLKREFTRKYGGETPPSDTQVDIDFTRYATDLFTGLTAHENGIPTDQGWQDIRQIVGTWDMLQKNKVWRQKAPQILGGAYDELADEIGRLRNTPEAQKILNKTNGLHRILPGE